MFDCERCQYCNDSLKIVCVRLRLKGPTYSGRTHTALLCLHHRRIVTSDIGPEKVLVRACSPAPFGTVNHKRPQRPPAEAVSFWCTPRMPDRILIIRLEPPIGCILRMSAVSLEPSIPTTDPCESSRMSLRCSFCCKSRFGQRRHFFRAVNAAARRDTIPKRKYRTMTNPRMMTAWANW